LLLIILNARTRNLVLVVNQVDSVSFYVVGTLRLLVSDPLFYLLGYYYGDRAVAWIERRSKTWARWTREFEDLYRKAAYPLVFIAPNNPICLLAGSSGMRPSVFVALNVAGTIARLYLITLFGEAFEEPINWVLDFIKEYRWYLLALTVGIVLISTWRQARSGGTEVHDLVHLEEELEGEGGAGSPEDDEDRT
jgi:membrane protein DedA with SNARE-associated domain